MTALATPFKVVTEFAFEEVQAKSADRMTAKVMKISEAAQDAVQSIKMMGMEMSLQFTGLGGGIIGMFQKAVDISEEYKQVQNDLASIITSSYKMGGGVDAFNKSLKMSEKLIKDIVKVSDEFALDESSLAGGMIPIIGALGTLKAKGKFKQDPAQTALDLSRQSAKFGTTFGIPQQQEQYGLQSMSMGMANPQLIMVQKLFRESGDVFAKFGIKSAQAFNTLFQSNPEKAIKALGKAFEKHTGNTLALEKRTMSLTGAMQRLRN